MNNKLLFMFLLVLLLFSSMVKAQSDIIARFTVHSGDYHRTNTPVSADILGLSLKNDYGNLVLTEVSSGTPKMVCSQVELGTEGDFLWWILEGSTPAGSTRKFELRRAAASDIDHHPIEFVDTKEAIHFKTVNKSILSYHYALTPVPEGVSDIYSRGGYIHPLWSPSGEVLTRIQPPDHYHHYGIWNPWTHTEFEGREVDFWNLAKGQATVLVKDVPSAVAGSVFGKLTAHHQHLVKKDSLRLQDKVALNENWELRVWNADAQQKIWLIDFSSTLSCASASPLTIKEYRYQGFGFRGNKNWDDQTATLTTSEGKNKSDANGTRARWCDINGPSSTGTSGILFMTNTANFNFPEQLRIWPTGMNEGKENVFINFNPTQDRNWELKPGNVYTLKYRMIVYDGAMDIQKAEDYWNDYAFPAEITIEN